MVKIKMKMTCKMKKMKKSKMNNKIRKKLIKNSNLRKFNIISRIKKL